MDKRIRYLSGIARRMRPEWLIRLSGQRVVFPFYHVVSNDDLPHIDQLYHFRTATEFEKDIDALLSVYTPVSMSDYLSQGEASGGRRRMVLSFDDGLAECHSVIAPILRKKGVPALFFLNNSFIDNNGLFYRYKVSLVLNRMRKDKCALYKVAEFLVVPDSQVCSAVWMINDRQLPLLDAIASVIELDFKQYMEKQPVYMSTLQVRSLVEDGFELGGHSMDHSHFELLEEDQMVNQVTRSLNDLQERTGVSSRYFAFPFTSDGVPSRVIDRVIDEGLAEVVMGTAGLKHTWNRNFIQRIPMEDYNMPALDALRTEYLYYLMKAPFGKNSLIR